jgi:site-specific recombinase XerD
MVDVTRPGHHRGRIPANKGKTYPAEILTTDEVRALLGQCSQTSSLGIRDRALITMLYRSGLRCAEALALHLKDVDRRVSSVTVLHGKGDRRRTVGIDPGALRIVGSWIERRRELELPADAPLFCTLRGTPIPSSQVRQLLPRLARQAGIAKRVHPHGLRHTHAYELMMEGVAMAIIQRQLGHLSLATTNTYLAHIAPKELIDTIRKREWKP